MAARVERPPQHRRRHSNWHTHILYPTPFKSCVCWVHDRRRPLRRRPRMGVNSTAWQRHGRRGREILISARQRLALSP